MTVSVHFSINDKRPQAVKDAERKRFFATIEKQIEREKQTELNRTLFAYGKPKHAAQGGE